MYSAVCFSTSLRFQLREWERFELNKESEHHFKEADFVHLAPQLLDTLIRYATRAILAPQPPYSGHRDNILVKKVYCGWNYSIVLSQLGQLFSFGWGMYAQVCQPPYRPIR